MSARSSRGFTLRPAALPGGGASLQSGSNWRTFGSPTLSPGRQLRSGAEANNHEGETSSAQRNREIAAIARVAASAPLVPSPQLALLLSSSNAAPSAATPCSLRQLDTVDLHRCGRGTT